MSNSDLIVFLSLSFTAGPDPANRGEFSIVLQTVCGIQCRVYGSM